MPSAQACKRPELRRSTGAKIKMKPVNTIAKDAAKPVQMARRMRAEFCAAGSRSSARIHTACTSVTKHSASASGRLRTVNRTGSTHPHLKAALLLHEAKLEV